jgi:hypothetical protein
MDYEIFFYNNIRHILYISYYGIICSRYRCTFGPGLMGGHEARKKKPGPNPARHEIISGRAGPARCIGPCLGRPQGPRAGTSPARLS